MADYLTRDQLAEYVGRRVEVFTAFEEYGVTMTRVTFGVLVDIIDFEEHGVMGRFESKLGDHALDLSRVTAIRSLDDE